MPSFVLTKIALDLSPHISNKSAAEVLADFPMHVVEKTREYCVEHSVNHLNLSHMLSESDCQKRR